MMRVLNRQARLSKNVVRAVGHFQAIASASPPVNPEDTFYREVMQVLQAAQAPFSCRRRVRLRLPHGHFACDEGP